EQAQERPERLFIAAVRRGGDEHEVARRLFGYAAQQLETLLSAPSDTACQRTTMGFVHDHEFGALEDEVLGTAGRLDEVRRDHSEAVVVEDRNAQGQVARETLYRARKHQLGRDVEL